MEINIGGFGIMVSIAVEVGVEVGLEVLEKNGCFKETGGNEAGNPWLSGEI